MDARENTYRKHNPFSNSAVHENEIWGEGEGEFFDVESIHEQAFSQLLDDIELVRSKHITQARFLVGAAGTGKSHLFARLRRQLSDGQFTLVSNPPTDHWAMKRHILRRVIEGMRRPARAVAGPLPYTQLLRVVYVLLRKIRRFPGLNVPAIHEAWKTIPREDYYPKEEELFVNSLEDAPEIDIPLNARRVLFRVLDTEKRSLATSWLAGSQALTTDDYGKLGVGGPLEDHEVADLLKRFGSLSIDAGPIVLVLDQLDGLRRNEQIGEIESLMIDFKDSSHNWYVIVSLVVEKFGLWNDTLSDPFKGRFGHTAGRIARLHVSELSSLTPQQSRDLLSVRLSSYGLRAQRERDGVSDPYYPLSKEKVDELAESRAFSARSLLQTSCDAYVEAVSGMQPPRLQLNDFLKSTFTDIRGQIGEDEVSVDTSSVADRIGELFHCICIAFTGSGLTAETGPLHSQMGGFPGSDRIYRCQDRQVRVVGHDVQHGNSFPSVLKRIVNEPSWTVLVRDGRIGASGTVTRKLLAQFRQDKAFIHLSLDEIRSLHSLGSLLAKMREGDFQHERTDPEPTEENILPCLARLNHLVDTDLVRHFTRVVGLDRSEGHERGERTKPTELIKDEPRKETESSPAQSDTIVHLLVEIMERERWLAFERLYSRVLSSGTSASPAHVYDCLRTDRLGQRVAVYPPDFSPLEAPGIIVWTGEE